MLPRVGPDGYSRAALLPLTRAGVDSLFFEHNKRVFLWSAEESVFTKRSSLPGASPPQQLSAYASRAGLSTPALLAEAQALHPANDFSLPLPEFKVLLLQQCLAPFAVFQLFSVSLMVLDDMFWTSLLTLVMLVGLEAATVTARLRTQRELRSAAAPMQPLLAFRLNKWGPLPPDQLLPGDIVSLQRSAAAPAASASAAPPSRAQLRSQVVPADLLLLSGSAIANEALLTGESTPQWKTPPGDEACETLDLKRHRGCVVFGGTQVVQIQPPARSGSEPARLRPPDGGVSCVVLRTGFSSSQGKLMRAIAFAAEPASAASAEAFAFIGCLLVVGIAAAGYVLVEGLKDEERSRWKLLLHTIMVLTSVVPPELPIELTVAVNASLAALSKAGVFCIEPHRISHAGKLDLAAFDKTGTLTRDELHLEGVATAPPPATPHPPASFPPLSQLVLAGCHSLLSLEGELSGDPLECAALSGLAWTLAGSDRVCPPPGLTLPALRIRQRLHFSPELRRMLTVVQLDGGGGAPDPAAPWAAPASLHVLAKGAPEALLPLCTPESLEGWGGADGALASYAKLARSGLRVLALAHRPLLPSAAPSAAPLHRTELETGLTFVGLALFASPIRPCSAAAVASLRGARCATVMLTGDGALTACHVAREVCIVTRPLLMLEKSGEAYAWVAEEGGLVPARPFEAASLSQLGAEFDLCVDGGGLAWAQLRGALPALARHCQVYARVSPEQKTAILDALRLLGLTCLMVGDGTNDTGALKSAHVGVALVTEIGRSKPGGGAGKRKSGGTDAFAQPSVRLGDASMAAPFTSKHASVSACVHVVRQGRAAASTQIQMYRILGTNCLVSAFALSVQYLEGVKWGDTQATVAGVINAVLFMLLALATPAQKLSSQRPHLRVFRPYALLGIALQFAAHLSLLWSAVEMAKRLDASAARRHPDADFESGLVNTAAFLASQIAQIVTFAVNYVGAPHQQSLTDNKAMLYTLVASCLAVALLASNAVPGLSSSLELTEVPEELYAHLVLGGLADWIVCALGERALRATFPEKPHPTALLLSPGV